MRYGYFDDARREYVITTPATPLPWINYLGSEDFLGMISNTVGATATMRFPGTMAAGSTTSRRQENRPGTQDSCPRRPGWTDMNAVTAWDIPPLIPQRTA